MLKNGSNFIGVYKEIQEIQEILSRSKQGFSQFCGNNKITWKFIPPRTPHFGGLWEEPVRSIKVLLRKIITPHKLQLHELSTIPQWTPAHLYNSTTLTQIITYHQGTSSSEDYNSHHHLTPPAWQNLPPYWDGSLSIGSAMIGCLGKALTCNHWSSGISGKLAPTHSKLGF